MARRRRGPLDRRGVANPPIEGEVAGRLGPTTGCPASSASAVSTVAGEGLVINFDQLGGVARGGQGFRPRPPRPGSATCRT